MDVKIYRNGYRKNGHVGGFILEVKNHILTITLYIVVFICLISGSVVIKQTPDLYHSVKSVFENFISSVSGQTLLKNFVVQLAVNTSAILLNFVFGLCVIGFPIPFFAVLIKGMSIGVISSFLYSEYGLRGFGFCMLVFFPVQLITTLILLFSGKDSVRMSISLLQTLTEKNIRTGERFEIKQYVFRSFIWFVITTVISFLSAVLNVYVVRLFDF